MESWLVPLTNNSLEYYVLKADVYASFKSLKDALNKVWWEGIISALIMH